MNDEIVREIERSGFFLATTNQLVGDVAKKVGYTNWKLFSNTFKEYYTEHPSPWRKNVKLAGKFIPLLQPNETKTIHLSGAGRFEISLLHDGHIECWDKIVNWGVKNLTITDRQGKLLAQQNKSTEFSDKVVKRVYSDIEDQHLNPVVRLTEGLELVNVSLVSKVTGVRADTFWKLELIVETRTVVYTPDPDRVD